MRAVVLKTYWACAQTVLCKKSFRNRVYKGWIEKYSKVTAQTTKEPPILQCVVSIRGTADYKQDTNEEDEDFGIIPEGGVYYVNVKSSQIGDYSSATAVYQAGDEFPTTIGDNDVYVYGDYEYRYNKYYYGVGKSWRANTPQCGWGIRVIDPEKPSYEDPVGKIGMASVVCASHAFYNCEKLIESPVLPNTINDLGAAFRNCTSLQILTNLPSDARNMQLCFSGCSQLQEVLEVPPAVTSLKNTFAGCTTLSGTIIIDTHTSNYTSCFNGVDFQTQKLTLSGISEFIDDIGNTGLNYCLDCNGWCEE